MEIRKELKKLLGFTDAVVPAPVKQPAMSVKGFNAAGGNRLLSDWNIIGMSPDADLRMAITEVRNRARDLVNNDGYAKKFVQLCKTNIVGPDGFQMQVKSRDTDGTLDTYANALIEKQFKEWTKKQHCTVTGEMSFRMLQEFIIGYLVRDGECFVRKVYNNSKFGFQLQVIEPDVIDEAYAAVLDNGNVISLGIEYDQWRKPVAYYIKKLDPRQNVYGSYYTADRTRVPAAKMYHLFIKERATQSRGISWFVQSMLRLKMLNGYEEAALVNARVSAAKMGFLTSSPDGAAPYTGDGKDASGNILSNVEPGTVEILPQGMDFKSFTPDYPQAQYEMYIKSILRGISSGLGVSYNGLANDLTAVNFSSIRAGLVEEREYWKSLQSILVESLLDDVFTDWLEAAFLNSQLGTLPVAKFDKFNAPVWTGRRWAWVDPRADVDAAVVAIEKGLKTRTMVLAEQGIDYEELVEQMAEEQAIAAKYGVSFSVSTPQPAASATPNTENTNGI